MKTLILALLLVGSTAYAKDAAGTYGAGAEAVTITTTLSPLHNDLTFDAKKTDTGTTNNGNSAVADPSGDGRDIQSSREFTLDGETYRFRAVNKLEKKQANGTWKRLTKQKEKKEKKAGSSYFPSLLWLRSGDAAPARGVLRTRAGVEFHLEARQAAPESGWFGPGEEVTSVPG